MTNFLEMLAAGRGETLFSPFDVLIAMGVSVPCLFIVTATYRMTHRGTTYAQSFLHALFLMGLCTGIVMMIIGSNIARAFSLVGALSIIRFRTAVKDSRDTGFLFFAIIVGMGCGTGFFMHTVVFTLATSLFMWLLFRFSYGAKQDRDEILKVTFRADDGVSEAIDEYLRSEAGDFRLINEIRQFDGQQDTRVYVLRERRGTDRELLAEGLRGIEGVTGAAFFINDQLVST